MSPNNSNRIPFPELHLGVTAIAFVTFALSFLFPGLARAARSPFFGAPGDDAGPQVALSVTKAGPRAVETLTEHAVLRDYKFAWARMSQALDTNSPDLMNGLLEGTASTWLNDEIKSQRRSGMSSRYLNQTHKVDAVFYAPEGDLLELHDTAEYDLQISDGGKMIHNQHVVVHYVVLMTPGADRWVVRQIQSVPQF
jgi:hypothetical protein